MKKTLHVLLSTVAAVFVGSTAGASTVYVVSPVQFNDNGTYNGTPYNALNITGSITTDGATGPLAASDVLSDSLTFTFEGAPGPVGPQPSMAVWVLLLWFQPRHLRLHSISLLPPTSKSAAVVRTPKAFSPIKAPPPLLAKRTWLPTKISS